MNRNARLFIYDTMTAMAAYWVCSGTVIAAMTSYYNMPLGLANILTGFTSTLTLLQMLGGVCYAKVRRKNLFLRTTNLLWRLCLPAVFFSVLLPVHVGVALFAAAVFGMVALYQFACPAQTAWMVNAVEGRVKASYYSIREMLFMLMYTVMFCAASLLIDSAGRAQQLRGGFLAVGTMETVIIGISIPMLLRLPRMVQPHSPVAEREPQAQPEHKKQALSVLLRPVWNNQPFMRVLRTNVMWSFACMFVTSFSAVYQIRTLQIPFSTIMLWATLGNLVRSLATPLIARLADHVTWRRVVQGMMAVMLCNALGWMCITPQNRGVLFPVLSVLATLPFAGLSVGFLQMQVDTVSGGSEDHTLYFSLVATLNGAGALLGSVLCSGVISVLETGVLGITDLRAVFPLGAVGIVCAMLLAQRIGSKSSRAKKPAASVR